MQVPVPFFHVNVVSPVHDEKAIRDYYNKYKRVNDSRYGNPFKQISATLTHLRIWEHATSFTSNDYLYVFEDDAVPLQTVSKCLIDDMEKQSPPLFYLGTCAPKRYGTSTTRSCSGTYMCSSLCLHAYAIRTNVSKTLGEEVLKWSHSKALYGHSLYRYNLDVKLRGYTDHHEKSLCPTQNIVGQQKWDSTIGHSVCCAW